MLKGDLRGSYRLAFKKLLLSVCSIFLLKVLENCRKGAFRPFHGGIDNFWNYTAEFRLSCVCPVTDYEFC